MKPCNTKELELAPEIQTSTVRKVLPLQTNTFFFFPLTSQATTFKSILLKWEGGGQTKSPAIVL